MLHRGLHFHPFFRVAGANGHHPRTISDSTIYKTGPPSSSSILALDQQPHLRFPSSLLAALHPLETGGLADISLSDIWPPYRQTRERQTVGLRRRQGNRTPLNGDDPFCSLTNTLRSRGAMLKCQEHAPVSPLATYFRAISLLRSYFSAFSRVTCRNGYSMNSVPHMRGGRGD
jgi:hypothetical protein